MKKKKGYVLVVDDEAYGESLRDRLISEKYNVHLARNSQEALKFLEKNSCTYKLAIVDWYLGRNSKMDGIELTEKITEMYPDIKVIELTQFGDKKLYDEALNAGAIRFVHKTALNEIIDILDSLTEMEDLDSQLKKSTPETYWLHQIITQSESGISIIDRTYRVLFINDSLRKMFPYKLKVGGICWVEFHRNETQKEPCPFCPLKSWFEKGKSSPISTNLSPVGIGRDLRYFDLGGSPIRDKDGKIIGGVKILTDVTKRERLIDVAIKAEINEELKDQLRIVLEGIQRLGNYERLRVYTLSDDTEKLEGLVEIVGTEADFKYSEKINMLYGLDSCKYFCYWEHMKEERIHLCDSANKKIGPHPLDSDLKKWLQISLIFDKKPRGMIEIDNKITNKSLLRYDESLIKKYASHAAHLIAVTNEIRKIRDRAKKTEEAYEELKKAQSELESTWKFIAARTAHKIGNPVFAIRGIIKNYQEKKDAGKLTKEYISEYMQDIKNQIERINDMVNDVKKFEGKIKLELRKVDMNSLVKETTKEMLKGVETKVGFNLDASLPEILVDSKELTDAFQELVRNAICFMKEKGKLMVGTSLKGDYIRIEFSDTGIGFSEDAKKHLFEPFFTTNPQRTGLGLASIKKIIEAHRGMIEAENIEEGGARFIISLPIKTKGGEDQWQRF